MAAELLRDAVVPKGMAVPGATQVDAEHQSSAGAPVPHREHSGPIDGHAHEEAQAQHADASSGEPGQAEDQQTDKLDAQPPEGTLAQQQASKRGEAPDARHQEDKVAQQDSPHLDDGRDAWQQPDLAP